MNMKKIIVMIIYNVAWTCEKHVDFLRMKNNVSIESKALRASEKALAHWG